MPPCSGAKSFGSDFVPPCVAELQEQFSHLKILSFVGHGGMGTYYRAYHPKLDRSVALKLLPVDPFTDAGLIEGFKKETKAMARLKHTNIIGIYEFIETEAALYLLMEFVEGDILERLINTRYFDQSEVLAIITQVCAALQHAHENGVIHRDLRPGNTMLDQSGLVKIGDFGLARLMGEELFRRRMTQVNHAMGTMDYVAPEQFEEGRPTDLRADIYSVGMMIYKLLTRVLPRGTFVVPSKLVPNLDPRIDELVIRCLQHDPDNRFQQVSDLWVEVNSLLHEPSQAESQAPRKKGPSFHFPGS